MEGHTGGVEDRDDQDRADVVDDRDGEEQDAERGRYAAAEQRQDAHGERDVRRHRDAPPSCPLRKKTLSNNAC